MQDLFRKVWVENFIFVYLKHKGFNLNAMIIIFKSILNCETLGVEENFQWNCSGQDFSKAYIYVTIEEKKCKGLTYAYIKYTQFDSQKCIICFKKSQKG